MVLWATALGLIQRFFSCVEDLIFKMNPSFQPGGVIDPRLVGGASATGVRMALCGSIFAALELVLAFGDSDWFGLKPEIARLLRYSLMRCYLPLLPRPVEPPSADLFGAEPVLRPLRRA